MPTNLWASFAALLPKSPLLIGTVKAVDTGLKTSVVELLGGGVLTVRGSDIEVGNKAFVRDGLIEGPAPDLNVVEIEI